MSRTLRCGLGAAVWVLLVPLVSLLSGCKTTQVFRLNPGEEPERYRIVCRDSSTMCKRRAKEECDGEYTLLHEQSSRPEQEEVAKSDLSSTGPSEGYVGWRDDMIIVCGRNLPPLHLARKEASAATTSAKPQRAASSASAPPPSPARVCVPGVTQACLGPGACSGAQACTKDGSGFGACDCGSQSVPSGSAVPSGTSAAP